MINLEELLNLAHLGMQYKNFWVMNIFWAMHTCAENEYGGCIILQIAIYVLYLCRGAVITHKSYTGAKRIGFLQSLGFIIII